MRWPRAADAALLAALLLAPWVFCVAWPLAAVLREGGPESGGSTVAASDAGMLLGRTLLWHALLAIGSVGIAWAVTASLPRRFERRMRFIASLTVGTALLAPWILFAAWWTLLAPGQWLHDWLVAGGHGVALRRTTLVLGSIGWGWAPAAIVLCWWRSTDSDCDRVLDRLDGVRGMRRLARALRRDAGGCVAALVVVMLALAGDVVCFDLAQERSVGFELRSLEAQGASASEILRRGAAASALSLAMLVIAAIAMRGRVRRRMRGGGAGACTTREPAPSRGSRLAARTAWGAAAALVLVPPAMLAWRMIAERRPWDFVAVHGAGAANALGVAAAASGIGAAIAILHALLALQRRGRPLRWLEAVLLVGWALAAILPSSVVAVALATAWSPDSIGGAVADTPIVVVAGAVARFSFVAALLGAIAGRRWARSHGDLEALDCSEPQGPRPRWAAVATARKPMLLGVGAMGALAVGSLTVGEVAIAARLEPPGYEWIASSVLAAIHYQRPGAAMAAIVTMAAVAFAAAAGIVVIASRASFGRSRSVTGSLIIGAILLAQACERHEIDECRPLAGARVIGGPGVVDGRFDRPRALAVDRARDEVIVIDKTARVQRFSADGRLLGAFRMPEWQLGQPVGISVDQDGRLLIPDTHYHRVVTTEPDGVELAQFGHYGREPGAFTYPTDVLIAPDGTLIVGEYGSEDRIQVLARDGRALRVIGGGGAEPGAFERPQSLALSRDGRELFVVDACNHRIQVFDLERGEVVRVLGSAGAEPGRLSYPWAVVILPDDSLLVAEQGNSRLQRLDASTGRSLGVFGGRGSELGRLDRPWALDLDDERIFIADTGNNRVQVVPLASVMGPAFAADSAVNEASAASPAREAAPAR